MTFRRRKATLTIAMFLGLIAPIAGAQQSATPAAPPPTTSAVDPEEQVDDGLKAFGYLTGLALGCVAKEQRVALEREAVDLNAEISRLMGADRAFLYAAAFGYGTTVRLPAEDCRPVLDRYEMRVAKFREGRGGRK
jgi:hypothetical protein